MSYDEICPICNKSQEQHNPEEKNTCNSELVKQGIMRYCSICGITKPAKGLKDRCAECGEKYSFSNY